MTQQVCYATATGQITQWQDTGAFSYSTAPSGTATLAVTSEQWAEQGSPWYVSGGVLTSGAPSPTLIAQAATLLGTGLAITSTGTPALNATYPTDPVTQQKMLAVQTVLSVTSAFPGGATSWPLKDASGAWHVCTPAQFTAIATAIAAFVAPIDLILDGHTGISLPASSATIA